MNALASSKRRFKCRICERLVDRKSRQQNYCSTKCRLRAWREKSPAEALKKDARYPYSGGETNPSKFDNKNNILQWRKTGSGLSFDAPLNLLGGGSWKWPGAVRIDSKTSAKIRWCEVGGELVTPPGQDE
jgi:endogenous inhibitor of DNA gyrase (YacG/DUF329 family)